MLGESPPALPPGETGGETWRKSGENEDLHHFLSESWHNAAKRQLLPMSHSNREIIFD